MVKNPDTGRRVSRTNDQAEWLTKPAPHLAIVPPELFAAVQQRKSDRSHAPHGRNHKPKHLFSGLLKCGCCGGGLSVKDRDHGRVRLVCTRHKESGSCDNGRHFYLDEIDGRVSAGLRRTLGSQSSIERFIRVYADERRRLAGDKAGVMEKLDRRLAAIESELERATNLLIKGVLDEEMGAAQVRELKSERATLRAERSTVEHQDIDLAIHPAVIKAYLASLDNLEAALRGPEGVSEETEFDAIRDLIEKISVTPLPQRGSGPAMEIEGDLARFLAPSHTWSGGTVVAEEAT